jgi:hypothetical protein
MTHRLCHLSRIATAGALLVIVAGLGASAAVAQRPAASEELVVRSLPRLGLPYAGLVDVSCSSSSFCMAVGSFGSGFSTGSFFERWNGRSWSRVRAFSPPASRPEPGANPGEGLQSLSCVSARDCWAVGYDYGRMLVEHYDGRSFTRSSAPVSNGNLISVSCSSARSCWAINTGLGTRPPGAPLRFNGHGWQFAPPCRQASPGDGITTRRFRVGRSPPAGSSAPAAPPAGGPLRSGVSAAPGGCSACPRRSRPASRCRVSTAARAATAWRSAPRRSTPRCRGHRRWPSSGTVRCGGSRA